MQDVKDIPEFFNKYGSRLFDKSAMTKVAEYIVNLGSKCSFQVHLQEDEDLGYVQLEIGNVAGDMQMVNGDGYTVCFSFQTNQGKSGERKVSPAKAANMFVDHLSKVDTFIELVIILSVSDKNDIDNGYTLRYYDDAKLGNRVGVRGKRQMKQVIDLTKLLFNTDVPTKLIKQKKIVKKPKKPQEVKKPSKEAKPSKQIKEIIKKTKTTKQASKQVQVKSKQVKTVAEPVQVKAAKKASTKNTKTSMSKDALYNIAKANNVRGRSTMKKEDLERTLKSLGLI